MPATLTPVTLTTTGATAATGQAIINKLVTDTFCTFAISGTYSMAIKFEVSNDGTTYYPVESQSLTDATLKTGTISPTDNSSVAYVVFGTAGYSYVRLYVVTATSGSLAVTGSTSALVGNPVLPSTSAGAVATTSLTSTGAITSSSPTAGVGYATGAGGAVTQLTDKSTTVVSNTITTAITMNNAALNAGVIVAFTFTNSAIAATDTVIVTHQSAGTSMAYAANAFPGAGSAVISVKNISAGNLSEAIVLRVTVIKSVSA
jgi:hypothetical protein